MRNTVCKPSATEKDKIIVFGIEKAKQKITSGWKLVMLRGFDEFHLERKTINYANA